MRIPSLIIIISFTINCFAQSSIVEVDRIHCGTAQINNDRLKNNSKLQELAKVQNAISIANEKTMGKNKKGPVIYTIPVVYHIIHNYGAENVSKAQIEASIQNLNEDFQKLNPDTSQIHPSFVGIAADCQIQFRLAHKDPNGNCTEGITRTVSTLTYSAGENVKSLVNWDTKKYLNIWVVNTLSSGAGGYSYYPGWAPSQSSEGIVIRSAQLGNSVTHEVGHYLNLPHCWGNSNNPGLASNCNGDDGVGDTPNTIGNTSCNTSSITCGSLDNVQNYMEYSFCERMFTQGQKSRMHTALNSSWGYRDSLWTQSNLIATGTNDPYTVPDCAPIADFDYNKEYICEGNTVTYTDHSYNTVPTSWNWTFNGGTPSTSSTANPTITYNTAGTYSTTHRPSTTSGTDSITKNNIITVSSLIAEYNSPFLENFENSTQFNTDWRIENIDNGTQTWQLNTTASTSGSQSIRIRNFFVDSGQVDELISPSFDISALSNKTMTFKQAFAKKTSSDGDRLLIYTSTNCGQSWQLRFPIGSSSLPTAPNHGSIFVPTATEWVERVIDLTSISSLTNVRFKFQFTSGDGNDIYIDDINIGGAAVGVKNISNNITNFNIYPNPTNSNAKISFSLLNKVNNLTIKVKNALGQNVTDIINNQAFNAGKYTLNIDEKRILSKGIYFIEFNADNNIQTKKLIIQ